MKRILLSLLSILFMIASCDTHKDCCGLEDEPANTIKVDTASLLMQFSNTHATDSSFSIVFTNAQGCNKCPNITVAFKQRPITDGSYTAVAHVAGANDVSISSVSTGNIALNFHTVNNGAQARVHIANGKINIIGTGLPIQYYDSTSPNGFVSLNLTEF